MYKLLITFAVSVMVACIVLLVALTVMLGDRILHVYQESDDGDIVLSQPETEPAVLVIDEGTSAFEIPDRRLTQQEIQDWIAEYEAGGSANKFETRLFDLINTERAESGLSPLYASPDLMMASRIKAQSMAHLDYFSYTSPIYGEFNAIPHELFGYPSHRSMGINIASGFRSPEAVFNEWMDNGQILEAGFTEVGLGFYDFHWTLKVAEGPSAAAVAALPSSSVILPERVLTYYELDSWMEEYSRLGGANSFELEVVRLTNLERESHGLYPLAINPLLMMIARFKAQSMGNLNYISHTGVYGEPGDLARAFGFTSGVGENLFRGAMAPKEAVAGWMDSPGHRQNLLTESYRSIGVGVYMDADGRIGWTQMFSF